MHEIVVGRELVSVGELIGKGGEGEVFTLSGRSGQAVKIYKPVYRSKREDKIRAMVRVGLAAMTDLVAYPCEVVSERGGSFLGFVMRLVSGYRPLHELYSPKSRQRHFPNADYRFVVRAALNVARAVGKVHQTGCVIGDLNHSGVLVSQDATVALIDADSFQIRIGGQTHPCVVGVPDFTPPELHGVNLGSVVRTLEHDHFGLAVAIFHLLYMGRHPYAGRYKGTDISMGDAIAQNRFAFSSVRRSATQTSPPPGALTLDSFPPFVSDAFECAFGLDPGARPTATEWIGTLTRLEASLNHCRTVKTHYTPATGQGCVWCTLAGKSGFDMFPDHSAVAPDTPTDARGTEQAIREILAFRFPTAADLISQSAKLNDVGSFALQQAKDKKRGRALIGVLTIAGAGVGLYFAAQAWFILLALAGYGWFLFSDREVDATPFREVFLREDKRIQIALDSLVRRNGLVEIFKVRNDLDVAIASYKSIDDDFARELNKFKATRESRQRAAYLDRFSIRRAEISGIGPAKTATLISFGIETAADVNQSAALGVPGFGDVMTWRLIDWQRKCEAGFRYDPTANAQDVADEKALRIKFANQKFKLEATIRSGLDTLRSARSRIDALPGMARNHRDLSEALEERAQAEQDLKLLGASVPSSSVQLRFAQSHQGQPAGQTAPRAVTQTPARKASSPIAPTCPKCGSSMRTRSGRFGRFWGCSSYPRCNGTRKI